jgi:hypothetical protein
VFIKQQNQLVSQSVSQHFIYSFSHSFIHSFIQSVSQSSTSVAYKARGAALAGEGETNCLGVSEIFWESYRVTVNR